MWGEEGGEVNGNRADGREEGRWCVYRLLPSAAGECQEKSSTYHREKKQTGNQNVCEHVRQEITWILGVIMYFPKRGEMTTAEDTGIPGGFAFPPPLALYGSYHLLQLINLSALHCSRAFAAQFDPEKQHLVRAGQKYGSSEPVEVPK